MKMAECVKTVESGDENNLNILIEKFKPLIKKYAGKLNYDEAESELIVFFIELIKKIPIDKEEPVIISYIEKSIKNRYIYLSKRYNKVCNNECELNVNLDNKDICDNLDDKILVKDILNNLTKKERDILVLRYIKEYSDSEIADMFNVSRQSIYKLRLRALEKAKNYIHNP